MDRNQILQLLPAYGLVSLRIGGLYGYHPDLALLYVDICSNDSAENIFLLAPAQRIDLEVFQDRLNRLVHKLAENLLVGLMRDATGTFSRDSQKVYTFAQAYLANALRAEKRVDERGALYIEFSFVDPPTVTSRPRSLRLAQTYERPTNIFGNFLHPLALLINDIRPGTLKGLFLVWAIMCVNLSMFWVLFATLISQITSLPVANTTTPEFRSILVLIVFVSLFLSAFFQPRLRKLVQTYGGI